MAWIEFVDLYGQRVWRIEMKIVVTGASGQLGYDVTKVLSQRGIEYKGLSSKDCDITDALSVEHTFEKERPDAVIHCAAYTEVDKAEDDRENCWRVNVGGTQNIALACRRYGAKMMYISTDYVFSGDGDRFYETDDPTGPKGVYGRSKLAGELAVQSTLKEYFIVRTSWAFGLYGKNFVKTMLELAEKQKTLCVVDDQIGSPTYTVDLARLLCDIICTDKFGVYHATNGGICSWADFAGEIFAMTGRDVEVRRITTEQYRARAARPLNSRLSNKKLLENGFALLPPWQDALKRYLYDLHIS